MIKPDSGSKTVLKDECCIKPFDAVFAWDEENTVHLSSGNAYQGKLILFR